LYQHFSQRQALLEASRTVVPLQPNQPASDASALAWAEYHGQMAAFYQWKAATDSRIDVLEEWQGDVEARLESHEHILNLVPEILERLGPQTLTPEHQNVVKYYVQQLSKATHTHPGSIYSTLYTAFSVPRYQEIPESEWERVEQWFKIQIERSKQKP
jgi:hypothetical protein